MANQTEIGRGNQIEPLAEQQEESKKGIVAYSEEYKDALLKFYESLQHEAEEGGITSAPSGKVIPENFWLALDDNRNVVGTLGLHDCGDGVGYVRDFFVAKGRRGGLAGGRLLKEMENLVEKNKLKKLFSATMPDNIAIHKFHQKHGFKKVETPPTQTITFRDGTVFFEMDLEEKPQQ